MINPCLRCRSAFEVTDDDLAFYDSVSPSFGGKKFSIPSPVFCPPCRLQQRMSMRNERKLFNDVCDLCGKDMISTYSPDKPFKVYCQPCWWSDGWDAKAYGRDFDFSRTYTEQMRELLLAVPRNSLFVQNGENSTYNNYAINVKNYYLCFGATNNEDCYYCKFIPRSKNIADCLGTYASELCYETMYVDGCYHCLYSSFLRNCTDCYFSSELLGCRNCIACFGLRQKEYHVFNEYVGKERFEKIKAQMFPLTHAKVAEAKRKLDELSKTLPHPSAHIYNAENCTGEWIIESKNCHECFDIKGSEDCKYIAFSPSSESSYDCTFTAPYGVHFCYQATSAMGNNLLFAFRCWQTNDSLYCIECEHSNNLFACADMNRAQFCILNKQYSKEEYETLVPKIMKHMVETGEWGKFFDPQLSAFGINETVAQEYFPMTKEEASKKGFYWSDYEAPSPQAAKIVKASQIPDSIFDIPDSILDWAIECEVTGKPFRIIKPELQFLRDNGLPLPRRHPDQRHFDRLATQNPKLLHDRPCDKCAKPIRTTFAPDRPERVFCEECYLKEVY